MTLLISAIAAILIGLSLTANPAKLVKDIKAKADNSVNVTANTTTNGTIGSQNGTTNIDTETDEKLETNNTANVNEDEGEKQVDKDENHEKAEGHLKVSVFNNRSGKFLKPLIPKVAVDHSDSLEASENVAIKLRKNK